MTPFWLISTIWPIIVIVGYFLYLNRNVNLNRFLIFGKHCYSCGKESPNPLAKKIGGPRKCPNCTRIDKCNLALGNYKYLVNHIKLCCIKFGIGHSQKWIPLATGIGSVFFITLYIIFGWEYPIYIFNMITPSQFIIDGYVVYLSKRIKEKSENS